MALHCALHMIYPLPANRSAWTILARLYCIRVAVNPHLALLTAHTAAKVISIPRDLNGPQVGTSTPVVSRSPAMGICDLP